MPINGVVTLADVVDAGYRGRLQSEHTAEMDRAKKQRGIYDTAGQRAQQAVEMERQQWVSGGGDPAKFRPSDTTMLKASEAFGQALAEGGDFQGYLKNEAAIQPHRLRVRQQAMQRYQMDNDKAKLLKTVYATIPDGQEIADVQEVTGGPMPDRGTNPTATPAAPPKSLQQGLADFEADITNPMANPVSGAGEAPVQPIQPGKPGDGRLGAPSGGSKLRVKISNGETRDVDFDQFMQGVQALQMDPMKEIELNYQRALAQVREGAKAPNIAMRGEQARQTQGAAAANRQSLAQANFQNVMKRDEANNAARAERTESTNDSRERAAQIRVDGTVTAAQLRGGGGGGGGKANNVQSKGEDAEGNVYLVMRDGSRKWLLDDSGRKMKSLAATKLLAKTANDLGKQDMTPRSPAENRKRAEELLKPANPSTPAGGRDLGVGIWK